MSVHHVVVDGSNLATEGRTLPSLQQLDDAVRAFLAEFAPEAVTVVVDATFPNRIDASEREAFEAGLEAGEVITPPAGVIGRGDAFVLQIADRADAIVLSNDSFQEFHGTYSWLFDAGRLIGGKPVPHVGWVFMPRSPVRGPTSRRAVSDAKKAKQQAEGKGAKVTKDTKAKDSGKDAKAKDGKQPPKDSKKGKEPREPKAKDDGSKARSVQLAAAPTEGGGRRRRRGGGGGGGGGGAPATPYNDALPFIEFVAAHPIGSVVEGEVERFASHGAYVLVDGTRCYLPLKHLADPPPRSAREVLGFGTKYSFVVHAFDTPRRGVDLTIPGVVPLGTAADPVDQPEEGRVAPAKKKAAAKKAPAKKKAAAKKAPAKKKAVAKKAPARKAPAKKKAAAKKAPARKKAAAKKAPAKKKAAAKKAPARKKAAAKKAPAKKKAAAKKAPARKKAAAKKAPAKKKAAAKKAPARKAPAKRKAAARKAPARRR